MICAWLFDFTKAINETKKRTGNHPDALFSFVRHYGMFGVYSTRIILPVSASIPSR